MTEHPWLRSVQRGHAPNCSSAGSAVGWAIASAVGAGVVLNVFADRFLVWLDRPGPGGGGAPDGDVADGAGVRVRVEPEGAVVAWPDPPALLHVSREMGARALARGARSLGDVEPVGVPGALVAPTEAHLAVTDRCPATCTGCYLSAGPDRAPIEPADLRERIDELAGLGVVEVAFGGGEALLRADILDLAGYARARGLVPNLTTSGFGLTDSMARKMAALFGQVNISLDSVGPAYAKTRGWDGVAMGLRGLEQLVGAGARVGVNTVLSRAVLAEEGGLQALGDAISGKGAVEWQWLRYKPVGRGADAWDALAPTVEQLRGLWPRALALESDTGLTVRWDCALTPFLADWLDSPERAARLGVHGCPGGERLWARSASGDWAACSFAPGVPATGALDALWRADPALKTWRARAVAPPAPCDMCSWRSVCRGGCRVVAEHLTGDALAADPQCPRVVAAGLASGRVG